MHISPSTQKATRSHTPTNVLNVSMGQERSNKLQKTWLLQLNSVWDEPAVKECWPPPPPSSNSDLNLATTDRWMMLKDSAVSAWQHMCIIHHIMPRGSCEPRIVLIILNLRHVPSVAFLVLWSLWPKSNSRTQTNTHTHIGDSRNFMMITKCTLMVSSRVHTISASSLLQARQSTPHVVQSSAYSLQGPMHPFLLHLHSDQILI